MSEWAPGENMRDLFGKEVIFLDTQEKNVVVDVGTDIAVNESEELKAMLTELVDAGKVVLDESKDVADALVDEGIEAFEAGKDFADKAKKLVSYLLDFGFDLYEDVASIPKPETRGISKYAELIAKIALAVKGIL